MKSWSFRWPQRLAISSAVVALVLAFAAINHYTVLAALMVMGVELLRWWRADDVNLARIQADAGLWMSGLASIVIIGLNPVLLTQIILAGLYGLWRWQQLSAVDSPRQRNLEAAITQGGALWAIFLGAAVWHWPSLVVLGLAWLSSYIVASNLLASANDRTALLLALTWALVVAECSWIFSLWLVNYIIFGGIIIIPQPALAITALGYCLAGIYVSHRRSQLSRARLLEYLLIAIVILISVIFGTKWNGVI